MTLSGKNMEPLNDSSFGSAFFYFPPRIVQNREKFFYSAMSLFAEIGGYIGLLLGVSLFHMARGIARMLEAKIQKMDEGEKKETKIFRLRGIVH